MGDEATSEARKSYKYTSNKDHTDGTEEIRLAGREPVRQGGVIELSESEHELLKGRLNLREVGSEDSEESSSSKQGQGSSATQESGTRSDSVK